MSYGRWGPWYSWLGLPSRPLRQPVSAGCTRWPCGGQLWLVTKSALEACFATMRYTNWRPLPFYLLPLVTDMLLITKWRAFSFINIDNLKWSCTSIIEVFSDFCDFWLQCRLSEWIATKWIEINKTTCEQELLQAVARLMSISSDFCLLYTQWQCHCKTNAKLTAADSCMILHA